MWNDILKRHRLILGLIASSPWLANCAADAAMSGDEQEELASTTEALTNGGFKLKNTNTGKCMTVAGTLHAAATLQACNAQSDSQRWGFDGGFLKHLASGLCLDIVNASQANGAAAQLFSCNGAENQDFRFYPTLTAAGTTVTNWYLVVHHSSKCLQPGGASGDQVVQSNTCLSAWNVEF